MEEVQAEELDQKESTKPALELYDFWAVWCGPCKIMDPILEELEKEFEGKMAIKKINIDDPENKPLMDKYNIMSVPTYLLVKDEKLVKTFIGIQSKATIANAITEFAEEKPE